MLLEEVLAFFLGIVLGIFAGIIPGIHSNTLASVLASGDLGSFAAIAIIAAFGAQAVFAFLPSIFFGIPDEQTTVSALPGHRMASLGKGIEALEVCVFSGIASGILSILLLPVALFLFPLAYGLIEGALGILLLLAVGIFIWNERGLEKKALAILVVALAGALGSIVLGSGIPDPLFPMFAGLFAVSGIVFGWLSGEEALPRQKEANSFSFDFKKEILLGTFLGFAADLLPGISSPAQMAVLGGVFVGGMGRENDAKKYLALISAIAFSQGIFAFASLESIGKARVGAVAIASEMVPGSSLWLAGVFALGAGIGALILLKVAGKIAVLNFGKLKMLYPVVAVCLFLAVFLVSGIQGIAVLSVAGVIGLLPPLLGVSRMHLMACLIIPTVGYYLF